MSGLDHTVRYAEACQRVLCRQFYMCCNPTVYVQAARRTRSAKTFYSTAETRQHLLVQWGLYRPISAISSGTSPCLMPTALRMIFLRAW